jgi:hypothetical protein
MERRVVWRKNLNERRAGGEEKTKPVSTKTDVDVDRSLSNCIYVRLVKIRKKKSTEN